jgi:Kelch motif
MMNGLGGLQRGAWAVAAALAVALAGGAVGPVLASVRPGSAQDPVPAGRSWDSWAYDPAQGDVVLFGGNAGPGPWPSDPGGVFSTTWTWAGGCWTEQHPATSPPGRQGAVMAWDPATSQLLLFGGARDASHPRFFNDTWTWTGTTWTQLHPATSPPARHQASMVYDAAMGEILLFGGSGAQGYFGDSWAWNGTTWTQLAPATSPSPRDTAALAYDPATQSAILYGGFNTTSGRLSDTWSWNGTTWTQLHPATSPGKDSPAWQAAYDGASDQFVVYGGDPAPPSQPPGPYQQRTWIWTGTTWTRLTPATTAGPRGYGAMTYDQAAGDLVLFGGNNDTRDPSRAMEWNGTSWSAPACS